MAITATQAIAFSNAVVRPMCERIRDIEYELQAHLVRWNGVMSQVVPDDAGEVLQDGRTAEGVTPITGADIHDVMEQFAILVAQFDVAGVRALIDKPTVRPLRAS